MRLPGPLGLAYLGDAVYTLRCRLRALEGGGKLDAAHREVTGRVRASAQAAALRRLWPSLTEEERDAARRGRNAHPHHAQPKSATTEEYALSTGFEALLGYLYLSGRTERLDELMERLEALDAQSPPAC